MFSQPHTVTWIQKTKDVYGTITGETPTEFECLVEERTRYGNYDNQLMVIGKGTVFTSSSLAFQIGDEIIINGSRYVIRVCEKCHIDGEFHHYELTYV